MVWWNCKPSADKELSEGFWRCLNLRRNEKVNKLLCHSSAGIERKQHWTKGLYWLAKVQTAPYHSCNGTFYKYEAVSQFLQSGLFHRIQSTYPLLRMGDVLVLLGCWGFCVCLLFVGEWMSQFTYNCWVTRNASVYKLLYSRTGIYFQ